MSAPIKKRVNQRKTGEPKLSRLLGVILTLLSASLRENPPKRTADCTDIQAGEIDRQRDAMR